MDHKNNHSAAIGVFDSGDATGAVDADIGWITGIRTNFRGNQFSGGF